MSILFTIVVLVVIGLFFVSFILFIFNMVTRSKAQRRQLIELQRQVEELQNEIRHK